MFLKYACAIPAQSQALHCLEATHTSKQTLACSQSLNHLRIAHPKEGFVASRLWRLPSGSHCACLRPREEMRADRASPEFTTTSMTL